MKKLFNLLSIKTERCNSKLHRLMINHVKSKAARCFFTRERLIFQLSSGVFGSLFPVMETEEIVTYPCQHDGPEGYDSPVPASERPVHRAQAEASQATTAHTHTHSYTPHSLMHTNAN